LIVGIIGIGLIGSSLAKAIRKYHKCDKIFGYDIDEENIKDAKEHNIYDDIISFDDIQKCDIIFIATNISSIIQILKSFTSLHNDAIVVDFGSTKRSILNSLPSGLKDNYIGAHPMAGKELSGSKNADEDLYLDKTIILTDTDGFNAKKLKILEDILNSLKMNIVYMNSIDHDYHTSFVSHTPHVISFALANSVLKQEKNEDIVSLAGGGFKDVCRIAKSSSSMWVDIFKHNKNNIIDALEHFEAELSKAKEMIKNDDFDGIDKWILYANKLDKIL